MRPVPPDPSPPRVALALQGGGAHGAYAWGAADRLLAEGIEPVAVAGVSSGALTAVALAQGYARAGAAGARREMRRLWDRFGQAYGLSPLRAGPLERWLFGWDMSNNPVWQGVDTAMRMFGPSQLNPFGHNPLRSIVEETLDRRALAAPGAPRLSVSATDVATGMAVFFDNASVTVDALLASCCMPMLFAPIEIGGRAMWDGAYSGNPPLAPLLRPAPPDRLILVRGQAMRRAGVPMTAAEITNRLNELACQATTEAEIAALPPTVELRVVQAEMLGRLPITSKFTGEPAFLGQLFVAGQAAAAEVLDPARPLDAAAD